MNNKLQINPPEGYEIDQDKSDLSKGVVHFKQCKKVLSYEDVANELFKAFNLYIASDEVLGINNHNDFNTDLAGNEFYSENQLESILALNKLCNVAKYLNGDWLPDWEEREIKYFIHIPHWSSENPCLIGDSNTSNQMSTVYFKTKELAQQAIEMLGKDEIRKALTLNH